VKFKSRLPRANPPICGECDRMFYGGGRFYVEVEHQARGPIKVHRDCADQLRRQGDLVEPKS
jgi:hypothetical protein